MTHAALMNAVLFFFLLFLTLLLVTFVGAVIVAPSAPPGSGSPEAPAGEAPAPAGLEAPTPVHAPVPSAPLPRRRPLTTATAAGTTRWSDAGAATEAPPPVYNGVRRPKVSGSPPWGPAPRPPGPDPWAAGQVLNTASADELAEYLEEASGR